MLDRAARKSNQTKRAVIGLVLTAALGVQCQGFANREASAVPNTTNVERVYAAAVVTDSGSDLDELAQTDPLAFLRRCREHYFANYRDYECTFTKQERLNGTIRPEQETRVRFREEPFSVNMRWTRNADAAAQVTYIAGRWTDDEGVDQAWCEPAGAIARLFVKKILQPIHGARAAKASRRTIDQFGFLNTLDLIILYSDRAAAQNALDLRYVGTGSVDGRSTYVFERRLPYTGQEHPYPDSLLVFHIDQEWLLPSACHSYADEAGQTLLGRYVLTNVTFNQGFTDDHFGPETLGG